MTTNWPIPREVNGNSVFIACRNVRVLQVADVSRYNDTLIRLIVLQEHRSNPDLI